MFINADQERSSFLPCVLSYGIGERASPGRQSYLRRETEREDNMTSKFEMNTITEIAVLNVAVDRILTHLARISPDPHSFLAVELQEGLKSLAKTHYWTVSHKNQKDILENAKVRYSELIGNIRPD
jgi:hypothetical protein